MTVKIRLLALLLLPFSLWGQWNRMPLREKAAWRALELERSKEALIKFEALCQHHKGANPSNFLGLCLAYSEPDRYFNTEKALLAADSAWHYLQLQPSYAFPKRSPFGLVQLDSISAQRLNESVARRLPKSDLLALSSLQSELNDWAHRSTPPPFYLTQARQQWLGPIQERIDSLQAAPVLASGSCQEAQIYLTQEIPLKWRKPVQDSLYQWAWNETLQRDRETAYLDYFEQYPASPYRDSAWRRADQKAYQTAMNSGDPAAYQRYLNDYPQGQFTDRSQYYLAYIQVIPVPILLPGGHYRYVDSSSLTPWLSDSFEFAWPYCLRNVGSFWTENGATFFDQHGLVLRQDLQGQSRYSYLNKKGEDLILAPGFTAFDELLQVSSQLLFVRIQGRWGCYQKPGSWLLKPQYENLKIDTARGVLFAQWNQQWQLFDLQAQPLLNSPVQGGEFAQFYSAHVHLPESLWIIEHLDGSGLLNTQTWTLQAERYSAIRPLENGIASFVQGAQQGYLDSQGIRFSAAHAESFKGQWAVYQSENGLWGVINRQFQPVVPAKYKEIRLFSSKDNGAKHAMLIPAKGNAYKLLNNSVQPVTLPEPILDAEQLGNNLLVLRGKKGQYLYSLKSEKLESPTPYSLVTPISNGCFVSQTKGSDDTLTLWIDFGWMGFRRQRPANQALMNQPQFLGGQHLVIGQESGVGVWDWQREQWVLDPSFTLIQSLDNGDFMTRDTSNTNLLWHEGKSQPIQADDASGWQFPGYYLVNFDSKTHWLSQAGRSFIQRN